MHKFEEVIVLNFLPDGTIIKHVDHINVLIILTSLRINSVVQCAVETTKTSVTAKGHEVGATTISFVEVPIVVRPHLGRAADTDLRLIHNKRNSLLCCNLPKPFVINWGCLIIGKTGNRLNNNSTNIFTSISLLLNEIVCLS